MNQKNFYICEILGGGATWLCQVSDQLHIGSMRGFVFPDNLVVAESSDLQTKFCTEKPAHRKSVNRHRQL